MESITTVYMSSPIADMTRKRPVDSRNFWTILPAGSLLSFSQAVRESLALAG